MPEEASEELRQSPQTSNAELNEPNATNPAPIAPDSAPARAVAASHAHGDTLEPQTDAEHITAQPVKTESITAASDDSTTENVTSNARPPPQQDSEPQQPQAVQPEAEERWYLKTIHWPPLPPSPSGQHQDLPSVRIVCQNKNGPCSLLALCNILILRHEVSIPHRQSFVTYSDLSALVADYLLVHPSPHLSLERALEVLPTTKSGLALNPRFGSIDGFAPSSDLTATAGQPTTPDEVLLFAACGIQLVHGWLVDPQDETVWNVLVEKHGDYDEAVKALVEGEELGGDVDNEDPVSLVERQSKLDPTQRQKVNDAAAIRSFLDASSTQLTIDGLFRLSELAPGSLVALFRNSHLSVLYVRNVSPDERAERSTPKTFELVTDDGMRESQVVWESLVDTSGAGDWYDASLRRISGNRRQITDEELARRMAGHSVQSDEEYARALAGQVPQVRQTDEELARSLQAQEQQDLPSDDAQLARQLQYEEDERERRHAAERQQQAQSRPAPPHAPPIEAPRTKTKKDKKTKTGSKDCIVS